MTSARQIWLLAALGAMPTAAAAGVTEASRRQIEAWLAGAEAHTPALLLGLAFLLAVPLLALAGLAIRRLGGRHRLPAADTAVEPRTTTAIALQRHLRRPHVAWLEIDGRPAERFALHQEIVRIGREDDNDIRLAGRTAHRYHAVVQRSDDSGLVVTDVSSADGNGILVNGQPARRARLADGDRIEVGGTVLVFRAELAT